MKTFIAGGLSVIIVIGSYGQTAVPSTSASAQPVSRDIPFEVADQGADYNVWQRTVYETGLDGIEHPRIHRVTELSTGLNHLVGGQFVASSEEINILPQGGAAATNAQHQAYFPGDIYRGTIRLKMPDGKLLESRPIGLSYDDGTNAVLFSELTNSVGYLVNSNQVIYPNAFTGFEGDLRYTFTKAGLEQDVIFRGQPPAPEDCQMDSYATRIQVLTEFFNAPEPTVNTAMLPEQGGMALVDNNLNFGSMGMVPGRAFLLGTDGHEAGISVSKTWANVAGRQILVEEVPVMALASELLQLPAPPVISKRSSPLIQAAAGGLPLPPQRFSKTEPGVHFAQRPQSGASMGLVMDYQTVTGSATNYVFKSDTTYYVSGTFYSYGTNTFEGGAVLKFATNGSIQISSGTGTSPGINWKGGAYRPVVFTAMDDNSVGENFGSGTPSGYYGNPMLSLSGFTPQMPIDGARFNHAQTAIATGSGLPLKVYDTQIVNCQKGIAFVGGNSFLGNDLFANDQTNLVMSSGTASIQNVTFCGSLYLYSQVAGGLISLANCILANVTNMSVGLTVSGNNNGFFNAPYSSAFGTPYFTNTFYPFQTVGGGGFYLTNGCAFINVGTTNLDSTLLGEIHNKTVYPPVVYANASLYSNLVLYPLAQRDNIGNPSLGYHYDPLDYEFGWVETTNSVVVNPGTAVGLFSTVTNEYGLGLGSGGQLICQGLANNLVHMVEFNTVQEGGGTNYVTPGADMVTDIFGTTPLPVITISFADWSVMAQDTPFLYLSSANTSDYLQNSQFHGGRVYVYYQSVNITNCLFERTDVEYDALDGGVPCLENNLFWNGTFYLRSTATNTLVQDNLFDQTIIPLNTGKGGHGYQTSSANYNAYVTNFNRLLLAGPNDVTLTNSPAYQTGTLGNYYLPLSSPLINMGHTNANYLGLYHFTTQTNQIKETNSIVDIGYHYVATDQYGNPLDSNGNGIPDYIEDANGNGVVDSGEMGWNLTNDLGLNVIISRPRNGGTLP